MLSARRCLNTRRSGALVARAGLPAGSDKVHLCLYRGRTTYSSVQPASCGSHTSYILRYSVQFLYFCKPQYRLVRLLATIGFISTGFTLPHARSYRHGINQHHYFIFPSHNAPTLPLVVSPETLTAIKRFLLSDNGVSHIRILHRTGTVPLNTETTRHTHVHITCTSTLSTLSVCAARPVVSCL